jgi:hypothetical protein
VSVALEHDAPSSTPARCPSGLRVADVTMFYGERSGGIRTYLEAKAAFAARAGSFEHHLIVPRPERSLRLVASNGYRLPLGDAGLVAALHRIRPHVVLLHDPFWTPRQATRAAHDLGAAVVAVHHSSAMLHAAGLPGPHNVYAHALRHWYRRAYLDVDAVMSVVDPLADTRRPATVALRLGIEPVFHPRPHVPRCNGVLYAGRLSREKGLGTLLDAARGPDRGRAPGALPRRADRPVLRPGRPRRTPGAGIHLVGAGAAGPDRAAVRRAPSPGGGAPAPPRAIRRRLRDPLGGHGRARLQSPVSPCGAAGEVRRG